MREGAVYSVLKGCAPLRVLRMAMIQATSKKIFEVFPRSSCLHAITHTHSHTHTHIHMRPLNVNTLFLLLSRSSPQLIINRHSPVLEDFDISVETELSHSMHSRPAVRANTCLNVPLFLRFLSASPSLRVLSLAAHHTLSDDCVEMIANCCGNVEDLNVDNCVYLSRVSVGVWGSGCG